MISIELNEINEDWVNYYIDKGKLKFLKKLLIITIHTQLPLKKNIVI